MPPARPWLDVFTRLFAAGAPFTSARRWVLAAATGPALPPGDPRWAAAHAATGLALYDPAGWPGLPSLRDPLPPADPDPGGLCALLTDNRRRAGAWYTPDPLVDWLVADLPDDAEVCDLACGAGAFLLGVLRATPPEARRPRLRHLHGFDQDAVAVDLAVALVTRAAHGDAEDARSLASRVRRADVLHEPPPAARFDAIVGNPPFLSRLRRRTDLDPATAAAVRARHGDRVGPYTDAATLFLLEADRATRPDGLVAQVLPVSVFANRDAGGARAWLAGRRPPEALWTLPNGAFPGVNVAVVATRLRVGDDPVRRRTGTEATPLPPVPRPDARWASLLAPEASPALWLRGECTLGDVAELTADFRDEYYALRGAITEAGDGPRLVTVGLVDPLHLAWGERPARLHGVTWARPRLDPAAFPADPRLRRWLARRLVPKVLVATQTRVIEAVADPDGTLLGTTPLLTLTPRELPLDELLAAVASPVATAWARDRALGTGLSVGVIRPSAALLRALPLPRGGLRAAGELARACLAAPPAERPGLLHELGALTLAAWDADPALLEPWLAESTRPARVPRRPAPHRGGSVPGDDPAA